MPSVRTAVASCIRPGRNARARSIRPPSSLITAGLIVFCFFFPDTNARRPGRPALGRRTCTSVPSNAQVSSAEGGYAADLRNAYANDRLAGAGSRALGSRPRQSCRAAPLALLFRRAEEERIARRPGRLLLVPSGYPAATG